MKLEVAFFLKKSKKKRKPNEKQTSKQTNKQTNKQRISELCTNNWIDTNKYTQK